jgi:hypothetical protein
MISMMLTQSWLKILKKIDLGLAYLCILETQRMCS